MLIEKPYFKCQKFYFIFNILYLLKLYINAYNCADFFFANLYSRITTLPLLYAADIFCIQ